MDVDSKDDFNVKNGLSGKHITEILRPERIIQTKSILDCDISSVTVYLDKAELCRTVPIHLESNQYLELLLTDLSMAIDKDSVRIEAKGAPILIQDVTFQSNPSDSYANTKDIEIQELDISEKEFNREKESFLAKQSRLKKQRAVLEKFADILVSPDGEKTTETSDNDDDNIKKTKTKASFSEAFDPKHMETLTGFFIMYENQAEKLDELILSTKEELSRLEQLLYTCAKQRQRFEEVKERLKKRELSIFIEARENVNVDLKVHYVVDLCSWKPCYDIRIFTGESKMKISYNALISQSTLEDWADMKQLIISTVQPPVGGSVPDIGIQKVFFKSSTDSKGFSLQSPPLRVKLRRVNARSKVNQHSKFVPNRINDTSIYIPNSYSSEETTTKEVANHQSNNGANRTQKEPCKVDIPCAQYLVSRPPELIASGGCPERVVVGYVDLNPTFEYSSVPKRAPYAFLKATAVNNSDYVILPGEANVFIDSNFVGKTEMKTVSPGEEFSCNLGADHRIEISYHPMYKYKEGSGSISKTMCLTYKQLIEIVNHHPNSIKMILMDQLPISNEEKIKVTLQEPTIKHPEKYDKSKSIRMTKNSQVEWDLDIGSEEKKEIILKYLVEYPAGECLDLINE